MSLATKQNEFIELLPTKPYCADNYNFGTHIRNKAHALNYQHIQVNSPFKFNFITLDIDYPIATDMCFIWETKNLPEPTFAVINPINNHSHLIFQLNSTVYENNEKQLKYYEDVKSILTHLYGADQNFTGTLTKNPFHKDWKTIESGITYSLADLKSYAPPLMPYGPKYKDNIIRFNKYKRRTINHNNGDLGHRCLLFETSRIRAYSTVSNFYTQEDFFNHMIVVCSEENPSDLNISDITSTAKSISHYTWKHRAWFTGKRFVRSRVTSIEDLRDRQSKSAKTTNETRHAKTLAIIEQAINSIIKQSVAMPTLTKQLIAKLTGKSLSTIKRYAAEIDRFIRCAYQVLSPVLTPQEIIISDLPLVSVPVPVCKTASSFCMPVAKRRECDCLFPSDKNNSTFFASLAQLTVPLSIDPPKTHISALTDTTLTPTSQIQKPTLTLVRPNIIKKPLTKDIEAEQTETEKSWEGKNTSSPIDDILEMLEQMRRANLTDQIIS